jgi:NAD-dependent DNA ligase
MQMVWRVLFKNLIQYAIDGAIINYKIEENYSKIYFLLKSVSHVIAFNHEASKQKLQYNINDHQL